MIVNRLRTLLMLFVMLAMILAACGVPFAGTGSQQALTPGSSRQVTPPRLSWTGTITMYAQHYTPNAAGAVVPLKAFREVADEYERLRPGINVQFVDEKFVQYDTTLRIRAANGELWDVFWAQWTSLNGTLPPGVAVDLAPFLQEANPYLPDAPTWKAAMNQTIVAQTAAPSGAVYNINGDFVATSFFYNKDLFAAAGITTLPTTWIELLDVAQKLEAKGIPPMAQVPYYTWWARHFLSDFYAEDYDRIAGFDKAPGVSALDEAVAMKRGLFSTADPRFMGWWPVFKTFTDSWVADYLPQPPENNTAAIQDFVDGKAAMHYSGSSFVNDLRNANASFSYGVFSFPVVSQDVTPLSQGTNTANAVGGANAGFQYAMSTPQANATMREAGKPEAVLDWLHYIGTPAVIEKVVNEAGSFVPTWPGTQPKPGSELLVAQADQEARTIQSTNTSPQLEADLQRIFGLYLSDQIDLEAAKPQVQQALDRALLDYMMKQNVNLNGY